MRHEMISLRWGFGLKDGTLISGSWSHIRPLSFGAGAQAKKPGVVFARIEAMRDGKTYQPFPDCEISGFEKFMWEFHSTGEESAVIGLIMQTRQGKFRIRADGKTDQELNR
jgi:hypothetical protein